MGLNIMVYKVKEFSEKDKKHLENLSCKKIEKYIDDKYDSTFRIVDSIEHENVIKKFDNYSLSCKAKIFDWEKFEKKTGINPNNWDSFNGDEMTFKHNGNIVKILIKNIPKKTVICKYILAEEIGYQRKGANSLFYEENMWEEYTEVFDKKTLLYHWKRYFSHETPNSKGDNFGSAVEYCLSNKEMKKRFKENIIDKFEEETCFVAYW